MTIDEADAKRILSLAADSAWDSYLDDEDQEFVTRVIAAFPGIEVPEILLPETNDGN